MIRLKTGRRIGPGEPVYVIAEIGINHNGDMDLCEELIVHARDAGADAVKFQMRTIDAVYSREELDRPRESPFGATNGDLKRGLELSTEQYQRIDTLCKTLGLDWSASPWDVESVRRLADFKPPWVKIAGPCVTDEPLLREIAKLQMPVMLSHGMSNTLEVAAAADWFSACCVMHCVSSYPTRPSDVHLRQVAILRDTYPACGYSGHEMGTAISIASVALGASVIERHLTASRGLWGSDQSVSLEPQEFADMVRGIREVERALTGGAWPRLLMDCERAAWEKLRKVKGTESEVTNGA